MSKVSILNMVKKHLLKSFESECDLYNALCQYRMDCINNGLDDTERLTKFLNGYEKHHIIELFKSEKQTKPFEMWFNKIFNIIDYSKVNPEISKTRLWLRRLFIISPLILLALGIMMCNVYVVVMSTLYSLFVYMTINEMYLNNIDDE